MPHIDTQYKLDIHYLKGRVKMTKYSAITSYFSQSDNTRIVAENIHETAAGDIFEIVTVDPYPHKYNSCETGTKGA
jgi:hypothetical protein